MGDGMILESCWCYPPDFVLAAMNLHSIFGPQLIRKRYHLLNYLVRTRRYRRYLEIGVRDPSSNFCKIRVAHKEGVDPAPQAPIAHVMTSDDFFANLAKATEKRRFDLVFIDGLHMAEQVEKDVVNALAHLDDGGALVLHDCNPPSEDAQTEDFGDRPVWVGTVWKAWAKLRATRPDLRMRVLDIDLGCGVIERGAQQCLRDHPRQRRPATVLADCTALFAQWGGIIEAETLEPHFLEPLLPGQYAETAFDAGLGDSARSQRLHKCCT